MNTTAARLATIRQTLAAAPSARETAQTRFNMIGLPAADWERIGA